MKPAVLVVLMILMFALVPVLAQESTPEATAPTDRVACDADLTLNLYIADRFFAFGAVHDQLRQSGSPAALDLGRYDYGQFGPLYTEMVGRRGTETVMPNGAMSHDWVNSLILLLPLDDASFEAQMASIEPTDAAPLPSAAIAGEAPECALLRAALTRFWRAVAFMDYSSGMNISAIGRADVGGLRPAETTPEATAAP
ncbi:MAG: hypothetical protein HZC41_12800 [Chloroflexi bacterium]|nr:hypothetical protein [Chloroflexota bacterium]